MGHTGPTLWLAGRSAKSWEPHSQIIGLIDRLTNRGRVGWAPSFSLSRGQNGRCRPAPLPRYSTEKTMKRQIKALKKLRQRIPGLQCIPGCSDCCGPVVFSKTEWDRVKDKRRATSITCPYVEDGKCAIYRDRPIICRLFGTVEDLQCPHGCKPEGGLLPKSFGNEIISAAIRSMGGAGCN